MSIQSRLLQSEQSNISVVLCRLYHACVRRCLWSQAIIALFHELYIVCDKKIFQESGSTWPRVKSARVSSAGSTRPAIFGIWLLVGNFILLIVPRRYFCCGFICFMFWSRIFVMFEPLRFRIFVLVPVTEWPPIGK